MATQVPAVQTQNTGAPVARAGGLSQPPAGAPQDDVAPVTRSEARAQAPAAPPQDDVAPVTRSEARAQAPAGAPQDDVAPVTRSEDTPESLTRVEPVWRDLLELIDKERFEELADVVEAIRQAKTRVASSRARFAWSRVPEDVAILLPSLGELQSALGEASGPFDAESLFIDALGKLLPLGGETAADLMNSVLIELEGLWLELPSFTTQQRPRLGIAVAVDISSLEQALGPFSMQRVYLKFGDFE